MQQSDSTGDLKTLEEKKKRRLERNRESARECRKRKKDKMLTLRGQVANLEADNLKLRLKLQIGPDTAVEEGKAEMITSRLESMINEGAGEVDIQNTIAELQERYSDYGRDRRSAISFHIKQLHRCLQPTQTTRTILWLISHAPTFHDRDGRLKPYNEINFREENFEEVAKLWYGLLDAMRPSLEQCRLLVDLALSPLTTDVGGDSIQFPNLQTVSDESDGMLQRLEELVSSKNDSLDHVMSEIQNILSVRQTAKFILWINQNPACMQMLEALWPHLSSSKDPDNSTSINNSDASRRSNSSGNNNEYHITNSSSSSSTSTSSSISNSISNSNNSNNSCRNDTIASIRDDTETTSLSIFLSQSADSHNREDIKSMNSRDSDDLSFCSDETP